MTTQQAAVHEVLAPPADAAAGPIAHVRGSRVHAAGLEEGHEGALRADVGHVVLRLVDGRGNHAEAGMLQAAAGGETSVQVSTLQTAQACDGTPTTGLLLLQWQFTCAVTVLLLLLMFSVNAKQNAYEEHD